MALPNLFANIYGLFYICQMNKDVTSIYTATCDNFTVVVETNLSLFIQKLALIEPQIRNYDFYSREFKKKHIIMFKNDKGKIYNLQKFL